MGKRFLSLSPAQQGYAIGLSFLGLTLLILFICYGGKASSIGVETTSVLAKPLDENTSPAESEILDVPDTLKTGDHILVKSETNSMELRYTTD